LAKADAKNRLRGSQKVSWVVSKKKRTFENKWQVKYRTKKAMEYKRERGSRWANSLWLQEERRVVLSSMRKNKKLYCSFVEGIISAIDINEMRIKGIR